MDVSAHRFTRKVTSGSLIALFIILVTSSIVYAAINWTPTTVPVGTIPGSFAVSPNGAATYSIPIKIPVGTKGIQPALSLTYNSQSGDNLVGSRWSIAGLSAVHRCSASKLLDGFKRGISYDDQARFCLDGQRLIHYQDLGDRHEYRTQRESWQKIIAYGSQRSNPSYWEVWPSNGSVRQYGGTAGSQIDAIGYNGTEYTISTDIRLWSLNKSQDVHGNYFTVTYIKNGQGGYRPDRIAYTGNTAA